MRVALLALVLALALALVACENTAPGSGTEAGPLPTCTPIACDLVNCDQVVCFGSQCTCTAPLGMPTTTLVCDGPPALCTTFPCPSGVTLFCPERAVCLCVPTGGNPVCP